MDALTDREGKDAAKYGLGRPAGVLSLAWKGGQGRVEIGSKQGTDYYARSSESPAVFTLAGYIVTDMQNLLKPALAVKGTTAKKPATSASAIKPSKS